jgi:hypothetical protein
MIGCSKTPRNPRNICVKMSIITPFTFTGIGLAVYSMSACRWFVFGEDEVSPQAWNLIDDKNSTVNFGLFRYEKEISDGSLQCFVYEPFFARDVYPAMFTAQICAICGIVFAVFAWFAAMIGVNKWQTVACLILTLVFHVISVAASMDWGKNFPTPWLRGSLCSLFALVAFFLACAGSAHGLVKKPNLKDEDEDSGDDDEDDDETKIPPPVSAIDVSSSNASTSRLEEDSLPSEAAPRSVKSGDDRQTAEELLGTNDAIIHRAVYQTVHNARDLNARRKKQQEMEAARKAREEALASDVEAQEDDA